jgi:fatty-acyl-CoA synthase
MLSHRGVVGSARYRALSFDLGPGDRYCNLLALFHTGGLVAGAYTCLISGIPLWLNDGFEPARVLGAIERHRLSIVIAFNTMMERLLHHPEVGRFDLSSWKKAATAPPGAFYDTLVEHGVSFVATCYEMTEGSNMVTCTFPGDGDTKVRRDSVGRAIPGVEVSIRDPHDRAKSMADGEVGEIAFRGWNRMLGYLDEPPEKTFAPGGWFCTGDRGYLAGGYLYLLGRYKDMIKSGGENVSPLEVELMLERLFPGQIVAVRVVGLPDLRWGERVVAAIQLATGVVKTEAKIIAEAKKALAGFKVPKSVYFVQGDEWPRLPSGKVDKEGLVAALAHKGAAHTDG